MNVSGFVRNYKYKPDFHSCNWCSSSDCSAELCVLNLYIRHGSSEGHEMLKRNDKYRSIADDVPIPKM